jgi:hypothetical protein
MHSEVTVGRRIVTCTSSIALQQVIRIALAPSPVPEDAVPPTGGLQPGGVDGDFRVGAAVPCVRVRR